MKRVVVTGATGTVGKGVIFHLLERDFYVIGVSNNSILQIEHPKFEGVKCNLLDEDQVFQRLFDRSPDCVVHCAAVVPKTFGEEDPSGPINERIDLNIIMYSRKVGARLVYMSTTSIYGFASVTYVETSDVNPTGSYLKAKEVSENRIVSCLRDYVILRICAPYSIDQRSSTVLKIFIENSLANRPLVYHGVGSRRQSFTSTRDIGEIVLLAVEHTEIVGIFNVTGPGSVSMKELAVIVKSAIPDSTSSISESGIPDPEEGRSPVYSLEKAKTLLGWVPRISIREGIEDWVSKRKTTS